jgi:hypothetical protein
MHVVALYAELDDPESIPAPGGQPPANGREHVTLAKRRQVGRRTQGDVRRTSMVMRCAPDMRDPATTWLRLTPSAAPPPTPGRNRQLELPWLEHLNQAYIRN